MFSYYYFYNPFFYQHQYLYSQKSRSSNSSKLSKDPCENSKHRLKNLEPTVPKNIDDPPWGEDPLPTKVYPISEVIEKGSEIPLDYLYNDPEWKRQAYKSYWHSKYWRWSYIPDRIHFAMHQLFTTYPTASIHYDFTHNLGIEEESKKFPIKYNNNVFDFIQTVVMKAKVLKIITYGNQVVLIAKPQINGLQVLDIPTKKIKPINPKEFILFQLVAELGDEMDYSLIDYVSK